MAAPKGHRPYSRRRLSPQKRRYAQARGRGRSVRQAAKIAGLTSKRSKRGVTGCEWERDPKVQMLIAEEMRRSMDEAEVANILAAQARGVVPTKIVRGQGSRAEFDTGDAAEHVARTLGMFKDHTRVDFGADPEAALAEVQEVLGLFGVTATPEEIKKRLGESAGA